jgi:hydrogenase-1 operon protein HyaE
MNSAAITDMLKRGQLQAVGSDDVDVFLRGDGLRVLFFAGGTSHGREAQDVAVALREVLREYGGRLSAALVTTAEDTGLQARFRVLALPSLVLTLGGETLEVIPRVRDWQDYTRAFRRYLGNAAGATATEASS